MKVGMNHGTARWAGLLACMALGCLATPAPEGSGTVDDAQRHEPLANDDSPSSFVEGLACGSSADCGRRFYCKYADGQCVGSGTCEVRPRACTRDFAPVCGCDDQTYANGCSAAAAGISIQNTGECGARD